MERQSRRKGQVRAPGGGRGGVARGAAADLAGVRFFLVSDYFMPCLYLLLPSSCFYFLCVLCFLIVFCLLLFIFYFVRLLFCSIFIVSVIIT